MTGCPTRAEEDEGEQETTGEVPASTFTVNEVGPLDDAGEPATVTVCAPRVAVLSALKVKTDAQVGVHD